MFLSRFRKMTFFKIEYLEPCLGGLLARKISFDFYVQLRVPVTLKRQELRLEGATGTPIYP